MPSHGDFVTQQAATSTYTVADKLTFYTEADIEIVEWGFIQTTAGVWTGTPCLAQLQREVADASGTTVLGTKTMSYALSPAVGARLYVRPSTAVNVAPGFRINVSCTQVGTLTAGAGAPFAVTRRKSFHAPRQTGDIDVGV